MYIRISISAQSAASTPPAPERMLTSASRSSYSPPSSVRTSIAAMSSCSFLYSASASASRRPARPTLFGGQFVDHGQVVEALPQFLDPAQFALGMGQLTGDLLGARLVVPQIGIGGLVLQLFDATAKPLDIEHPLHRGQGGVEGGDVGLTVGIHGSSGVTGGKRCTFSIGAVTSPATTRQPLARGRAATENLNKRYPCAHTTWRSSVQAPRVTLPRPRC